MIVIGIVALVISIIVGIVVYFVMLPNTQTDVLNCGKAGNKCKLLANGTRKCEKGKCIESCTTGYTMVNDKCEKTCAAADCAIANGTGTCNTTTNKCGGKTCDTGYTMVNGVCQETCDATNCPVQ